VGERVDEHRDPQRIRPEDPFLAAVVGDAAGVREHRDGAPPFVLGELHLAHERVEMAGQRAHHGAEPLVLACREAVEHGSGDVVGCRRVDGGHPPSIPV